MSNTPFFDAVARIERLVPGIAPTFGELEDVLSDPDVLRVFFDRLDDPAWIKTLSEAEYFVSPPPSEDLPGGGSRAPSWPASRYLRRMSSLAPGDVASVFRSIHTNNWVVASDIIEAAKAMPAEFAAILVDTIGDFMRRLPLEHDLADVAEIVSNLAADGRFDDALRLANMAFSRSGKERTRQQGADTWYAEALRETIVPALLPHRPRQLLDLLLASLRAAVEDQEHYHGDRFSYVWRPAIEEHPQNHDYDVAAMVVSVVRHALELATTGGHISLDDAVALLKEQNTQVCERLRLHLFAEYGDRTPELARQAMMDHDLFNDYVYRHEYARLVANRWTSLEGRDQRKWLDWVNAGPPREDGEVNDEFVDLWKAQRLHWIRDHLTGEPREFYDRMKAEHGAPEYADLVTVTEAGYRMDESPFSLTQLQKWGFERALQEILKWEPDKEARRYESPSVEGLASEWGRYVASDPAAYSSKAEALKTPHAHLVRRYIDAMAEAVKAETSIDANAVLSLCEWVVEQPPEQRTTPELPGEMLDPNWLWCRDSIAMLIDNLCKAREGDSPRYPLDLTDRLLGVIEALLDGPATSYVGGSEDEPDPRFRDWIMVYLNSPRGKAMQTLWTYAEWAARHKGGDLKEREFAGGLAAIPGLQDVLEQQLTRADQSFTERSGFGARLGLLLWLDRAWLAQHAEAIFNLREPDPAKAFGWAAWNVFLYSSRPHAEFYSVLKDQFRFALEQAQEYQEPDRASFNPVKQLGQHLMVLYGRGNFENEKPAALDPDGGIIAQLLTQQPEKVRRQAIAFVGRSLEGAEDVPQGVLDRFKRAWEFYWDRVGKTDAAANPDTDAFSSWFACGAFDPDWSFEHFDRFVQAAPQPGGERAIVERLAKICDKNPLVSARVVRTFVESDRDGWRVRMWDEQARKVLEVAMAAGGEARTEAEKAIDRLGRMGFLEFGKLLKIQSQVVPPRET